MMKLLKRMTAFLLVMIPAFGCLVTAYADTYVTVDGFSFYTNANKEAVIVDYDDSSSRMEIPATLLNATVSEIADNAFFGDSMIQEISFENATGLRRIGNNAFCDCTSLTAVTLPPLDELGFGAFQGCTNLQSLTVSDGLTSISEQAFYDCVKLEEAELAASVTTIGDYAFGNCTLLKSVIIPATVTTISDVAFYNCDQLVILCYTDSAAHLYAQAHEIPFVLLDQKGDIADAVITLEEDVVRYDGTAHEPAVTVTYNGTPLDENTDYTLSYSDNTAVGTATIRVIGCGDYEGEQFATFAIKNVLGDAYGDGYIDTIDATVILRRVAGMDVPDPERVDLVGNVTGTGYLDALDATVIQRWLAGMRTPYPVDTLMD